MVSYVFTEISKKNFAVHTEVSIFARTYLKVEKKATRVFHDTPITNEINEIRIENNILHHADVWRDIGGQR